jgi:hypothetical protein
MAGLAEGFPGEDLATYTWQGQVLKGEVLAEAGQFNSQIVASPGNCGGQNCGMWAISMGSASGDNAPGPCGSSAVDPFTGQVDMSHSYGLFQDTPACEGTFLQPSLPAGYTCTGTGMIGYGSGNALPFSASDNYFYCESATGNGVMNETGQTVTGVIDAVTNPMDPQYAKSIFNPAYYLFVHIGYTLAAEFQQANAGVPAGCSLFEQFYKTVSYWLNGQASSACSIPAGGGQGGNLNYAKSCISNWEMMSGTTWTNPQPM